uniref:Uncharacterized protein n=1 Tax=Tanacetum cinerariifolium TaxID=118510 RepID=A0A6L2NVE4_TANCI|nr:hypothetical protein [Tanacetum cinerariifolium]
MSKTYPSWEESRLKQEGEEQHWKLFSRGNSLTQQWEHFFTNSESVTSYLPFELIKCTNLRGHLLLSLTDFMYQTNSREISSARKEHMPYLRFTKVIIDHFISKDNTISMRNMINLHIIHDDTLLVPPKKARKFKKPASPKLKIVHASPKEPIQKGNEAESWGDSENESAEVNDKDDYDDDDIGNDDDGSNDAEDSEQTDSNDEENPSFTLKYYEEEKQDKEYVFTPEKDKSNDEEKMFEEEDDDVAKELYGDLNITQGLRDINLTNAEQGREDQHKASHESEFVQEEEDAHVTLTTVYDKTEGPLQSFSISSNFTSKLLNLNDPSSNINSLMNTSTIPPLPLPVSALETKVSEFNQTSQFAKVVSSILDIVDNYLASKLKEEVNVAVHLQSNKLKKEAGAENQEFFNQVDSTVKTIIKEQVKAQVSKIMPQIEKYVTESLGAKVLSTQVEELEFEATNTEMHQDQGNESSHIADQYNNEAAPKHEWFQKPNKPLTPNHASNKSKYIDFRPPQKWISTIAKECYKERQPPQGREYSFNLSKTLPLIEDRGRQVVPADYFINNDRYLKGGSSSSKYATSTTRTKAAKYDNIEGIEDMVRNDKDSMHMHATGNLHMMSTPKKELLRLVLHDIASNLDMDYLPKRHWSHLEMKRSRIMVKAIDKLVFEMRLMRNLGKFVGGCDYEDDLRLLERTI